MKYLPGMLEMLQILLGIKEKQALPAMEVWNMETRIPFMKCFMMVQRTENNRRQECSLKKPTASNTGFAGNESSPTWNAALLMPACSRHSLISLSRLSLIRRSMINHILYLYEFKIESDLACGPGAVGSRGRACSLSEFLFCSRHLCHRFPSKACISMCVAVHFEILSCDPQ
eukprot:435513-Pelagomonas_calceolata.AAC.1